MPKRLKLAVSRLRLNDHRVSIWASLGVCFTFVVAPIDSRTPFLYWTDIGRLPNRLAGGSNFDIRHSRL